MITLHNWEEYAILRADGELDAAQTAALEAFLRQHPELAGEAAAFDALKLLPDEEVVFDAKESLLRREPRVIALSGRPWLWAAAACLTVAVGSVLFLQNKKETRVAGGAASRVQLPATVTPQNQKAVAPMAPSLAVVASSLPATSTARQSTGPSRQTVARRIQPERLADNRTAEEPLAAFTPVAWKPLNTPVAVPEAPLQPSVAIATPPASRHSRHVPLLDDGRLQPLQEFADAAAERIAALRATREKLRETEVAVSVGRRELFKISL